MSSPKQLLERNRAWAREMAAHDPECFHKLAAQQAPDYLWIGCSDSRVPANQIVGLQPGEIFVHRNVSNLVIQTDLNCLSVLQYAVDVLQVKHIIVCGHYGCGGVLAALRNDRLGLIDNWLRQIQNIAAKYQTALDGLFDEEQRCDKLCELNVIEQVLNVCHTTVLRDAWARHQAVAIHGWIYRLQDGLIRDLNVSISNPGTADLACRGALLSL
ncbi:MAG: carbonate dehydratase [Candidatus Hydrogenedentes bacterium]|nr:carbonate dehydratase [Candidatus Hydrogenedentota bacterium]